MPRKCDSGRIDLKKVFCQLQSEMLSQLAVREVLEHASTSGAATERRWIQLFERYLPERYRASSAFVVDADGRRSRQIDIAIYDRLYSPPLLWHEDGLHLPAESVYAVFEVKQVLTRQWVRDAGRKAASVRRLRRTSAAIPWLGGRRAKKPQRILGGILAQSSVWAEGRFGRMAAAALRQLGPEETLDLGCVLKEGAFEVKAGTGPKCGDRQRRPRGTPKPVPAFCAAGESLIFFVIRLIERLRAMGTAPAVDWMEYGKGMGL